MKRLVLAAAFATLGITAVVAQSDPIAVRRALMKENNNQVRIAREMIDGTQPFNLDAARNVFATFGGVASKFNVMEGTLFSQRQDTVEYRWVNYATLLEMSKANPVFGIGWGNWMSEWPKYIGEVPGIDAGRWADELTDGNHNTFLGLFAEVGLVGLIPYLMIFYYMFLVGVRVYANGKGFERDFSLVFLLVMATYLFGANFSDYRSGPFFNTTLFLIFGCVAAMDQQRRRPMVKAPPVPASRGEFGAEPC